MDLIQKAKAQTLDEIASPTIPFTPPTGVTVTPTVTVAPQGPSISLNTQQFVIGVSEKIKIQVVINTKGTEIKEYSFQITFNPELLEIVDAEPGIANTQIDFTDTLFDQDVNVASQQTGIITLTAKSDTQTVTITDRVVAEFELTGKKEGLSQVALVRDNSALIDANSTDILESTNELSVTVSTSTAVTPTPSTGGATVFPTSLPENALFDGSLGPQLVFAILLILSGLYIVKSRDYAKKKRV